MRILIATAGRHGGTHDIGRRLEVAIRTGLAARDVAATIDRRDAGDVTVIADYDAMILGSAVYLGRWSRSARQLIDRAEPELGLIPVWLFSSGPIGGDESTKAASTKWDDVPWALDHRVFGGRLVRADLSRFERFVVTMLRVRDGDDRSDTDIAAWGESICDTLALRAASAERA